MIETQTKSPPPNIPVDKMVATGFPEELGDIIAALDKERARKLHDYLTSTTNPAQHARSHK